MYTNREFQVGVYIRLSKDDGDDRESESVENQRDIITDFIEKNEDLELYGEYVDDGYTGTNFDRPSFKRLIEDIEKGKINCVITKDLSRFGRDHIDTGYYLERYLPGNNIRYIAIGDGIDTKTSSGLNFMTFKLSFNDYYSLDISNKIKAVKKRKAEKGEYQSNFAPFGYKKDPQNKNHLIINKENSQVVKRIFDLYLNGHGTPKIVDLLNKEKIPTPSSYIKSKRYENCKNEWSRRTVHGILTNEVYIGTIVGRKSYKVNHKVKKRIITPKKDRIYVENMHEPIISKEDFKKVQERLKDRGKWRDRENNHPFKKLMYCGKCGAKATLKIQKRKVKSGEVHCHKYFICSTKSDDYNYCDNGTVRASIITPIIQDKIKEECSKIVFSKGDITSIYEQAKLNSNNKKNLIKKEIDKYEKEVKDLDKKVSQIYEDKLEGLIKHEDFSKFYNKFQDKKEKYINEIKKLKLDLEKEETNKVISYTQIKKLADEWLNSVELDEELIQRLIERIEFKGRDINIKYKFTKQ